MMVQTSLNRVDSDFIDNVEDVVSDERTRAYQSSDRDKILSIFRRISYLRIPEDDPINMYIDIVRSRIFSGDTETVLSLLDRYSDHVEAQLEDRYREFKTSHSNSQLVSWYLLSPIEDTFRIAVNENSQPIPEGIISRLRSSIESWADNNVDGIPEVFFRLFGSITIEYISECDTGQAREITRDYTRITSVVASDIDSPGQEITDSIVMNFSTSCLNFAMSAIDEGYYQSATSINHGLRSIVEAKLRIPSKNPDRELLMMGLIGEQFAAEQAKSKNIVGIANEISVMDQAEWTVTTLVTFKDKIEKYGNGYAYKKYLDYVMLEINRVNDALEEKDQAIAAQVDHDEKLVVKVIRGGRLFRRPFSVEDLIEEIDLTGSRSEIGDICSELEEAGALERRDEGRYMASYDEF
jgi:hypothetical protein